MNSYDLHEEAEFLENMVSAYSLAREVAVFRSLRWRLKLPWPDGSYLYLTESVNGETVPKIYDSYDSVKEAHDDICCKGINGMIELVME